MSQITYTNKETLNAQPSIADKNKVTANDMNEIKTAVNDNDSRITTLENKTVDIEYETPTKTGRRFKVGSTWKDEYIYYKNIGNLANSATATTYETSISQSSITMITDASGIAVRNDGVSIIMNGARPQNNASAVSVQMTWSNSKFAFYVETGQDRSSWVGHCWVTYY